MSVSCPDTGLGLFKLLQTWPRAVPKHKCRTEPKSEGLGIPAVKTKEEEIDESQEETKALALIGAWMDLIKWIRI